MSPSLPPIERPGSARPRSEPDQTADAAPISDGERRTIEQQLVELASLAGATVADDPELGASLVRWPGRGPALNHAELVRWPGDDDALAARLGRLEDRLGPSGDRPAVLVAPGLTTPGDLGPRLAARGWRRTL